MWKDKLKIIKENIKNNVEKNSGYVTLEVTLIVPMVIGILMLAIYLMIDCIYDAAMLGTAYTDLYSYNGDVSVKELADATKQELSSSIPFASIMVDGVETEGILANHTISLVAKAGDNQGSAGQNKNKTGGAYSYESGIMSLKRDYKACADRLRRWQLYGDVIWE